LGRELPFFLGKGENAFAERLAATAVFCVNLANIVVVVTGLCCAIAFSHRGPQLVCSIIAVTLMIAFAFYQQIFTTTFRSKDSFKTLTKLQFVDVGTNLGTVPIVYFFHFYGMLGRTVAISGISLLLMYIFRPMRFKGSLNWKAFKLLLKTGFPIFGLDYVKNSCATLDRVILLKIGGVREVGVYALAGVALQTLSALPTSLSSYLYPRMSFKFGQNGNPRELWRIGFRFVVLAFGFTGLATVCAWLILPYFVPAFIPKYLGGLRAAQIVLIAGVFEGATLIVNALWSMKAWRLMVAYQMTSAILFAVGPIVGVMLLGKSLEAVAWGAVIGAFGRAVFAFALTFYGTHGSELPSAQNIK